MDRKKLKNRRGIILSSFRKSVAFLGKKMSINEINEDQDNSTSVQSSQNVSQKKSNTQFLQQLHNPSTLKCVENEEIGNNCKTTSQIEWKKKTAKRSLSFQNKQEFASPPKLSSSPTKNMMKDKHENGICYLEEFFNLFGIKTNPKNNHEFLVQNDPRLMPKMIQEMLCSGDVSKENITQYITNYLNDVQNVKKMLEPTIVDHNMSLSNSSKSISVAKIFLQVPVLQTSVLHCFLDKLIESIFVANSIDEVRWTISLLQQLRFLAIISDPESLATKLVKILESAPSWFQSELIIALPDIVSDSHHHIFAEMLCRLIKDHDELTNEILNCIGNLSLGTEYYEELRATILNILENYPWNISNVAEMVKFCTFECPNLQTCKQVLRVIRKLEISPLEGEDCKEYFKCQTMVVQTLKTSISISKTMFQAAIAEISNQQENDPYPLDFIIVLLLYEKTKKIKKSDNILNKHVKCGYYRESLLCKFYKGFEEIAKDLQTIALKEAGTLLTFTDLTVVEFSIDWFRKQFKIHHEISHKQREIIEKIILLMGHNDQTAKNALRILKKMTEIDEEKNYLQAYCNHLKILIYKVDQLDLEQVAMLSDILFSLCPNSLSEENALQDDLYLLLRKQLLNTNIFIKSKGVVSAVMAIKHLAKEKIAIKSAKKLIKEVGPAVENFPGAQALFYDYFGQVVASEIESLDPKFLNYITRKFEKEFILTSVSDEMDSCEDLVPKFQLNNSLENDAEKNEHAIKFSEKKTGITVPALFRFLKMCYKAVIDEHDSQLLVCGIYMPNDLLCPDSRTLDMIFHCINWHRELINAFVNENDLMLKQKVFQRLDNLISLQIDLCLLLPQVQVNYQPPACHFYQYPPPAFKQVVKKETRKFKKRHVLEKKIPNNNEEIENNDYEENSLTNEILKSWEMGSLLGIKNPMYFRRLDATIAHLFEVNKINISLRHICFLAKELLSMLNDKTTVNEIFMKDLVKLLPKIVDRLKYIVDIIKMQQVDENLHKHTIELLLNLLSKIFSWKGFNSSIFYDILQDALRELAAQVDGSDESYYSTKEIVAVSYSYFENLTEIATDISLAYALVVMCETLLKRSRLFSRENKDRQSRMAFGFLCLEWPDDYHVGLSYQTAVTGLLKNWMNYESNPLKSVSNILQDLPQQVQNMERAECLETIRTINLVNFHFFYQRLFNGLIAGIKISLSSAKNDAEMLMIWEQVAKNLRHLINVCKEIKRKSMWLIYLRYFPILLKIFIDSGIPIFERNLRYQPDRIMSILKRTREGIIFINAVYCHNSGNQDLTLAKLEPAGRKVVEQWIYSVKAMLAANNSSTAFLMSNLINKNLDGEQIFSQVPLEEWNECILDNDDDPFSELEKNDISDDDNSDVNDKIASEDESPYI